jgi:hypothetical protein
VKPLEFQEEKKHNQKILDLQEEICVKHGLSGLAVTKEDVDGEMSLSDKEGLLSFVNVLEHIENPDMFLEKVKKTDFKVALFISTERDLVRGKANKISPDPCRYREWNTAEFLEYIRNHFEILQSGKLLIPVNEFYSYVVCVKRENK